MCWDGRRVLYAAWPGWKTDPMRSGCSRQLRGNESEEEMVQCAGRNSGLADLTPRLVSANRVGGGHEASYLPSHHRLSNDNMGLRDFLDIPRKWKHRRARSEARRETNPVEATRVDLTALPRSQPDLGIESSTPPTPTPSTSKNREQSGTCKVYSEESI